MVIFKKRCTKFRSSRLAYTVVYWCWSEDEAHVLLSLLPSLFMWKHTLVHTHVLSFPEDLIRTDSYEKKVECNGSNILNQETTQNVIVSGVVWKTHTSNTLASVIPENNHILSKSLSVSFQLRTICSMSSVPWTSKHCAGMWKLVFTLAPQISARVFSRYSPTPDFTTARNRLR